jgi:hypothetical protein
MSRARTHTNRESARARERERDLLDLGVPPVIFPFHLHTAAIVNPLCLFFWGHDPLQWALLVLKGKWALLAVKGK